MLRVVDRTKLEDSGTAYIFTSEISSLQILLLPAYQASQNSPFEVFHGVIDVRNGRTARLARWKNPVSAILGGRE